MIHYQQPLHCPICVEEVPFVGEEGLRSHLAMVHYKCRPYPCTLCAGAERFPTEAGLRHHVESQHGVMQYKVGLLLTFPWFVPHSPTPFQIRFTPTKDELRRLEKVDAQVGLALELRETRAGGGEELQMVQVREVVDRLAPAPQPAVKVEEPDVVVQVVEDRVAVPKRKEKPVRMPKQQVEEPDVMVQVIKVEEEQEVAHSQQSQQCITGGELERATNKTNKKELPKSVVCRSCQESVPDVYGKRLSHVNTR